MVLDVDGLPVEVHGHQPGSQWSGYYHQRMYPGLVASCAETGDLLDGELYPGASYLGDKALKMTLRVVDRCRGRLCDLMRVRMVAGFPEPGLLEGLESRSVPYIARIRKNEILNRMAQPYLTQPAGRSADEPPRVWFHELSYQAVSWDRARRVVRERPGELMDVLDPALSAAPRPKTHYRGKPLAPETKPEARTEAGVRPHSPVIRARAKSSGVASPWSGCFLISAVSISGTPLSADTDSSSPVSAHKIQTAQPAR